MPVHSTLMNSTRSHHFNNLISQYKIEGNLINQYKIEGMVDIFKFYVITYELDSYVIIYRHYLRIYPYVITCGF